MGTNAEYGVLPHDPNYQHVSVSSWDKDNTKGLGGGLGCLTWGVICFVCYFVIGTIVQATVGIESEGLVLFVLFVPIVVASLGVAVLSSTIRKSRLDKMERTNKEQARQAELNRVTNDAKTTTSMVLNNYQTSTKLVTELPDHLSQADAWLKNAEAEYNANAFGPFWDAVENAALHLDDFNTKTKQLSNNASQYYRQLNGRKHTFPTFPVKSESIPDASVTVNEMRRIVRMGQTNFQFANIWEHRRTREVLIAGFQTLGEAVNNLGLVIDDSIYNLQQSVSSDVARFVDEQIRTRESLDQRMLEQNRMLDNIQHHRQPSATDTPQKW